MQHSINLILFCCAAYFLTSCSPYTWVAQTVYYPPGSNETTAEYILKIEVHGEHGYAYSEKTSKNIYLSIWKNKVELLKREYKCVAASLEWHVLWKDLDRLHVVFFDFGDTITSYEAKKMSIMPKKILGLDFTYYKKSKVFTEAKAPSYIIDKLNREKGRDEKRRIITLSFMVNDKEKDINSVLNAIKIIAKNYNLSKKDVSGWREKMAEYYFEEDFYLTADYYDPAYYPNYDEHITIILEDYGKRELSNSIREDLKKYLKYDFKEIETGNN